MSGDDRTTGRDRCPTCRAPRHGEAVCHRCRSDLGPLIRLEGRVDLLRAQARRCYARGWYRRAAALAEEMVALESSPENLRLRACAALMAGDFLAAARTYRRHESAAG
jgi:hypothetical protein